METKTIKILAETIYIADNYLRDFAFKNKAFPVGIQKTETKGVYIGEYTIKKDWSKRLVEL